MSLEKAITENTVAVTALHEFLKLNPNALHAAGRASSADKPAAAPATPAAEKPKTDAPTADIAALRKQATEMVLALVNKHKKRDQAVAILKEFGAGKVPEVKDADVASLVEKLTAEVPA